MEGLGGALWAKGCGCFMDIYVSVPTQNTPYTGKSSTKTVQPEIEALRPNGRELGKASNPTTLRGTTKTLVADAAQGVVAIR